MPNASAGRLTDFKLVAAAIITVTALYLVPVRINSTTGVSHEEKKQLCFSINKVIIFGTSRKATTKPNTDLTYAARHLARAQHSFPLLLLLFLPRQ